LASGSTTRFVDRLPPVVVQALTAAGFGVPVALYIWMVHTYAVNLVVNDQFDDVTVIRGSYVHFFDWHLLWGQHNETRIFVSNLVAVMLAHFDHFNVVDEDYLSAFLLLGAVGLLMWAHKRRSPNVPWLYYCPVAFLLLTVAQWQNSLWGFQLAWYLTMFCLMAAIFFVDRLDLNAWSLALAATFGVVGSLSLIQGFLIWPLGLFLMYHRKRLRLALPWLIVAAATAIVYFRNFNTNLGAPYPGYASQHPWASLRFFVFAAGDILGVQPQGDYASKGYPLITLFGVVLLIVAAWVVVTLGVRRDDDTGTPIGVTLILFATLFDLMVTKGRIIFGYAGAGASRYTTFDILFLCGIYLALLGRKPALAPGADPAPVSRSRYRTLTAGATRLARNRRVVTVICVVTGVLIVVQAFSGYFYGFESASNYYRYEGHELAVEQHAASVPALDVAGLYLFVHPASWVLRQLETLHEHRLGPYG